MGRLEKLVGQPAVVLLGKLCKDGRMMLKQIFKK